MLAAPPCLPAMIAGSSVSGPCQPLSLLLEFQASWSATALVKLASKIQLPGISAYPFIRSMTLAPPKGFDALFWPEVPSAVFRVPSMSIRSRLRARKPKPSRIAIAPGLISTKPSPLAAAMLRELPKRTTAPLSIRTRYCSLLPPTPVSTPLRLPATSEKPGPNVILSLPPPRSRLPEILAPLMVAVSLPPPRLTLPETEPPWMETVSPPSYVKRLPEMSVSVRVTWSVLLPELLVPAPPEIVALVARRMTFPRLTRMPPPPETRAPLSRMIVCVKFLLELFT